MAVSDGKFRITDKNSNTYEFEIPSFGYETEIIMSIDFSKLENGNYASFDYGESYDKRICRCSTFLTVDDKENFDKFFLEEDYEGRYYEVDFEINNSSGFYPFGPDKGDGGIFTVLLKAETEGIQDSPFRRFKVNLEMINVGDWPPYSAPPEVTEGSLQIGSVTGLRFPENYFQPEVTQSNKFIIPQDTSEYSFLDKGFHGDRFNTKFTMTCNNSRAYELIYYLTQSIRSEPFVLNTGAYNYPFGRSKGNSGIVSRLIQNEIKITHEKFNKFSFELNLSTGDYDV